MVNAIVVNEHGGPEVLTWSDIAQPQPGPGEALVRHKAIGLNFLDTYFRTGLYPAPSMPFTPGSEGAGDVVAIGPGVTEVAVGDRVAYSTATGAYAEERVLPADRLVAIPDDVSYETAAAMVLKGMTAQYLLRRTYRVEPGDTILIHAAAGGVGLIACQWANYLGATVIGTVGSEEKAALARAHGAHHTINYRTEDFVERVREITGGEGVAAVYDSVAKDTYPGSLDCLKPLGTWALFGQSSGPIGPIDLSILAAKGSLFATRPTLFAYVASREDLVATASELFDVVGKGVVKININQTYALKDAAQAHRDLEGRKTTGATILVP